MKNALVLTVCMLVSATALAEIVCKPDQIKEWPHNPYVVITDMDKTEVYVSVGRSYYGYSTDGSFVATTDISADGSLILTGGDNTLTLSSDGDKMKGLLVTAEYGSEELSCSKIK